MRRTANPAQPDFEATELLSDTDHIDPVRQLDPQHKAAFGRVTQIPQGKYSRTQQV